MVIIGYHDLRVGSDVRTEALVASRRGEKSVPHGHRSQSVLH